MYQIGSDLLLKSFQHTEIVPDGQVGDLWRCDDCGRLWRIGSIDSLYPLGDREWRPAWAWQRLMHRARTQ